MSRDVVGHKTLAVQCSIVDREVTFSERSVTPSCHRGDVVVPASH